MKVDYVNHMGDDLTVVNSARVSFNKESQWETEVVTESIEDDYVITHNEKKLSEKDNKLISYLAKHDHWTPFAHCFLQIRVKAPIFVARQLVKHQIGLVWNEISRRYVDTEPEFFIPEKWRAKPKDSRKQGSDENENVVWVNREKRTASLHDEIVNISKDYYNQMIEAGVAPEQARMILPQSAYTEWYWSGSLPAFARVCNLRLKPDSQLESRMVAEQIDNIAKQYFPVSWAELRK